MATLGPGAWVIFGVDEASNLNPVQLKNITLDSSDPSRAVANTTRSDDNQHSQTCPAASAATLATAPTTAASISNSTTAPTTAASSSSATIATASRTFALPASLPPLQPKTTSVPPSSSGTSADDHPHGNNVLLDFKHIWLHIRGGLVTLREQEQNRSVQLCQEHWKHIQHISDRLLEKIDRHIKSRGTRPRYKRLLFRPQ